MAHGFGFEMMRDGLFMDATYELVLWLGKLGKKGLDNIEPFADNLV